MDYKLTFEDGSSAYLMHHGVKGMHWGERKDEAAAGGGGGAVTDDEAEMEKELAEWDRVQEGVRANRGGQWTDRETGVVYKGAGWDRKNNRYKLKKGEPAKYGTKFVDFNREDIYAKYGKEPN